MKNYKDFEIKRIGMSDIAKVTLISNKEEKPLYFGEDGSYDAYLIKRTADEKVTIGSHYSLEYNFKNELTIKDDEEITLSIKADIINVYRAGEFGCIIEVINPK